LPALLRRHQRLLLVLLFLLVLWGLVHVTGVRSQLSLAFVQAQLMAHPVVGLLMFVLLFCLGNLIQVPGWVFLVAAVFALGQWVGGVVTYVAACTSCFATFWLIRRLGGDALQQLQSPLARRILQQLDARPVQSVVLTRLLFQTLPALNYALALSGIRWRHYALGTLLGLPLPIAAYCFFIDALVRFLGLR
jgi:uncharacterized membrane protein YdjX (TVP38/TMEM64 family)